MFAGRPVLIAVAITVAAAAAPPLSVAQEQEPTRGAKCGLSLVDVGDGGKAYLEPITGRKNISCAEAQEVVEGARKATDYRYLCAKKSRYRKWTIRHIGPYEESLSARFTKGKQRFRVDSQGSCV